MRTLLSLSAAALCLCVFTSCSSSKVTKADVAAFKLRDLTRFGQPHIVKIDQTEIQQLEQAELRTGRMASLDPKHLPPTTFRAPPNFALPSLPNGAVTFDGSILPPKQGGGAAVMNNHGSLPGARYGAASYPAAHSQNFSIE